MTIFYVSCRSPDLLTVCLAITLPEIPRVTRLVRSAVRTVKGQAYVEAAISMDALLPSLIWSHILPNITTPMIVHGTYIALSAILIEAALSFLAAAVTSALREMNLQAPEQLIDSATACL